ncbi:hypothetical protein [Thiolapillus sp.]|uniref:hypothetical protein n=1 Tax=Thiolapillus sp. TaxID=2017437 RepID=UPI003AF548E1
MKTRLLILLSLFSLSFSAFAATGMTPEQMQMLHHANPMPNLMHVIMTQGDKLELTEKQSKALDEWHSKNHPRIIEMVKRVAELEKTLANEALDGASGAVLQQITNEIFKVRENIIKTKLACRNNMHNILNPKQWDKVVELYKAGKQAPVKD